ncbi:phage tail tube protein [Methylobacterium sp. E-046]|uniref:phage tail tube protein n=1 Tax=Methylobacterium sp. E-046 TaxID=2836576 RepID=UPI001FB9575B|nr:phage tail tube protein [Methylobacterium sp. E-046]MCJ2098946.1 phage tail tube protein [Methylobacterium sp. E-046]
MDTKGGRYSVRIGGQRFSGRGKASIKPAQATPKADPNRDGTAYRTVEAKLAMVSLSFDRGSKTAAISWTSDMLLRDVDVTFIEDDAGRTHYFTSGSWVGEPDIDTDTGEVTGMSVASDQYRAV